MPASDQVAMVPSTPFESTDPVAIGNLLGAGCVERLVQHSTADRLSVVGEVVLEVLSVCPGAGRAV